MKWLNFPHMDWKIMNLNLETSVAENIKEGGRSLLEQQEEIIVNAEVYKESVDLQSPIQFKEQ